MKLLIVFAALCAVALAAPPSDVKILTQNSEVGPEDFTYGSSTSDGTEQFATGELKDVGTDHEALVVRGAYTWVDEETGEKFVVTYTADETGFHPSGHHLPVA